MNNYLIMPKKIKIGFQERYDTYTNKLAYITYEDNKGKIKKEKSWNNWRSHQIPVEEYDNIPTSGFVLNKQVGGYKTDWSFRQSYIRVYDSRGFEFEITLENLLYILNNCICTPGKGLEGEFVYAWNGTELILLPTKSPDYNKICEYNQKLEEQGGIDYKNLKIGATYLTKDKCEYIYLGKYDWYDEKPAYDCNKKTYSFKLSKTIRHIFAQIPKSYDLNKKEIAFYCKSMAQITVNTSIIGIVTEEIPEYLDLMLRKINESSHISPVDYKNIELKDMNFEQFKHMVFYNKNFFFYREDSILMFSNMIENNDNNKLENDINQKIICYYNEYNSDNFKNWREKKNMKKLEFSNLKKAYEELNPKIGFFSLQNGNPYKNTLKSEYNEFHIA